MRVRLHAHREAWETFGLANGVSSIYEFLTRVGKYRRGSESLTPATQVGCTLLRDVRFFDPVETRPRPDDFATNIVQGRTYDLDELDAQHPVLIAAAQLAMPGVVEPGAPSSATGMHPTPRLASRSARPRVGSISPRASFCSGTWRRCSSSRRAVCARIGAFKVKT
jgi:putative restriction endonuclease